MNSKKGFVALTLVITVSSLLLAFTFIQSIEVAHFFDQTERKQYRLMNYYNAYSCIDLAVLNIAHDYFYEVSVPVSISDMNCSIDSVQRGGENILIRVHGDYKKIKVFREATLKLHDNRVEIISIT